MKFILQCLNRESPNLTLTTERATRLGPTDPSDAPFSHVEAYPDYVHGKVRVKNLGASKCLINFQHVLRRGDESSGNPGDLIDLTFGSYVYRIREFSTTVQAKKQSQVKGKESLDNNHEHDAPEDHREEMQKELESQSSMVIEDSSRHLVLSKSENKPITEQSQQQKKKSSTPTGKISITDSDWKMIDGNLGRLPVLIYGDDVKKMKPKVAAFDLDGTIIVPKPGVSTIPTAELNEGLINSAVYWKFNYDSVAETLRQFFQLHTDYKFIIVTNKAKNQFAISKMIIEQVILELDIPAIVFAAKEATEFLKPAPFVWQVFTKFYNEGVEPDWSESFYCGDCAGRPNDISKGDRLFALNVGVEFKTPEEFFLDMEVDPKTFILPIFKPKECIQNAMNFNNDNIKFPYAPEMIIMCGSAGSGKTRYVETTLLPKGYIHVSLCLDMLTPQERLDATTNALKKLQNVVIDRRNIDKEERISYIRIAKAFHTPVRCFVMDVSEGHVRHNLRFHELRSGKLFHPGEVELGLRRHKALFEPPSSDEGFIEINHIHFVPQAFINEDELQLYSNFLLSR